VALSPARQPARPSRAAVVRPDGDRSHAARRTSPMQMTKPEIAGLVHAWAGE